MMQLREQWLLLSNAYKRDGFAYILKAGFQYVALWPVNTLRTIYYKLIRNTDPTFTFQGNRYKYFFHSYNTTWSNPRKVEIPIIWQVICENKGKRVLEIGNVLRHYFPYPHDVIDLYENYIGVSNRDIVDFRPDRKYDLVVSISTFEHIGFNDKEPEKPEKFMQAIQNVVDNVLAEDGQFILTVPLGDNIRMEEMLHKCAVEFTTLSCMRKTSADGNKWREIDWATIVEHEMDSEGHWKGSAQTVVIGKISRKSGYITGI